MEQLIHPGTAGLVRLASGEAVAIVDVEGKQVADLIAFSMSDPETELLFPTHTLSSLGRLKLQAGDTLLTNHRRPTLRLEHDDVGVHDMSFAMCDRERYRLDFGLADHPNCREAMTIALTSYNIPEHRIPDPINVFQNLTIGVDGVNGSNESLSRAGDKVSLIALMDTIVVVSACPQDKTPINGWAPTPVIVRSSRAAKIDESSLP